MLQLRRLIFRYNILRQCRFSTGVSAAENETSTGTENIATATEIGNDNKITGTENDETIKTKKKFTPSPEWLEYKKQLKEMRKQFAKETASLTSQKHAREEDRKARRIKEDAEWQQHLSNLKTMLNDPEQMPDGIESVHKALKRGPQLSAQRAFNESRDHDPAEAMQRHHEAMSKQAEDRKRYLEYLKAESADWITEDNLDTRIQIAIDNPVDYGEQLQAIAQKEAETRAKLDALKLSTPVTMDDTTILNIG